MTFETGTQLDHYRLVEPIGEGGMGVVWKARDASLDRDVAIKVLPESLAGDEQFLARFEREAKAVAALSHPNIVGIFGFGRAKDQAYAVMELLEGQTLRDLLDQGPLPPRQAVDLARQVAEGLDAAHGKGIVHRDLKPENVFVTADGRARILDFGLATALPGVESGGATSLPTQHLTTPGRLVQLTENPAADWDGAFTPDGKSILWSSDRTGNYEIWIADADGANPRQVSRDGVDAQNPTMTPGGDWVVYASTRPEHHGLVKVRTDGTDSALVVAGIRANAEVSPDGRYVSYLEEFAGRPYTELRVAEIATGRVLDFAIRLDFDPQSPNVTFGRHRWLPDGTAIAYVGLDEAGHSRIFIQDFVPGEDTSETRRPLGAVTGDTDVESFGISPDGNRSAISTLRNVSVINLAEGLSKLR